MNRGAVAYAGVLDDLHERFAVVRGFGPFPETAGRATIGLRRDTSGHWEGLIRVEDTGLFGPDTVIDRSTIDDVVVHLAEQGGADRKGISA